MHIKQLEISGFKSFVDRTVIQFDHDIIGVVGPNGCGKSNIVDAIRWCMGEQSAKHLRGRAMADVIFAGSESRAPVGLAEVTLTFDNGDPALAALLPLEYRDYPEIAVTRRLYRDGASEYLINKTQVRLKDITDLFLGTGVGTKAYSIIEQGKIGLIVSARAEDRRLIIEEAAGITKYKFRRKQAEQKMELTRQNLARVGDIVAEIERNLASLRRQAQKAERYRSYRAELEDLMLHDASHRYLELTVVAGVEQSALAEVTEGEQQAKAELGAREGELEGQRMAAFELEAVAEAAQAAAFTATNDVRGLEAELARGEDRLRSTRARADQASQEVAELEAQL
ncbi:MAG: AAA family ATPase, partial [Polyangiaceae bacterium]|nr:AAA family ATPase [Polyangiaceae bacterium]